MVSFSRGEATLAFVHPMRLIFIWANQMSNVDFMSADRLKELVKLIQPRFSHCLPIANVAFQLPVFGDRAARDARHCLWSMCKIFLKFNMPSLAIFSRHTAFPSSPLLASVTTGNISEHQARWVHPHWVYTLGMALLCRLKVSDVRPMLCAHCI